MQNIRTRFVALGIAALTCWAALAIAAPVTKKNAGPSAPAANLGQDKVVLESGAPDTDTRNSPSVSPHLSEVAVSAREVQAPSPVISEDGAPQISAAAASATTYQISWQLVGVGGEASSSSSYESYAVAGQEVAGQSSTPTYQAQTGYIYGVSVAGGGCDCPCKYDPACDGTISDVLDVVETVNRAFRGLALPPGEDAGCPKERRDVNASGAVDVIDVVNVVNVAFRGGTIAQNYVDPCPAAVL